MKKARSRQKVLLRAITVRQPWAHAILHLGKNIENRSWPTHHRGPLLIHAGTRRLPNPREMLAEYMNRAPSEESLRDLPCGCIVGVVDLVDCVRNSKSKWADREQWHWVLQKPRPLNPVKCKGRLGLWMPSPGILRALPNSLHKGKRPA
jgi:hypothetical protein